MPIKIRHLFLFLITLSFLSCEKESSADDEVFFPNGDAAVIGSVQISPFPQFVDISLGGQGYRIVGIRGNFIQPVVSSDGSVLTMEVGGNYGFIQRDGAVYLKDGSGVTAVVTVTQGGLSDLVASDIVLSNNGVAEMEIYYNGKWTITSVKTAKTLASGDKPGAVMFPIGNDEGKVILKTEGQSYVLKVVPEEMLEHFYAGPESVTMKIGNMQDDQQAFSPCKWIRFFEYEGDGSIVLGYNEGDRRKGILHFIDRSGNVTGHAVVVQAGVTVDAERTEGVFGGDGSPLLLFNESDVICNMKDGTLRVTDPEGCMDLFLLTILSNTELFKGRELDILVGGMIYGFEEKEMKAVVSGISESNQYFLTSSDGTDVVFSL